MHRHSQGTAAAAKGPQDKLIALTETKPDKPEITTITSFVDSSLNMWIFQTPRDLGHDVPVEERRQGAAADGAPNEEPREEGSDAKEYGSSPISVLATFPESLSPAILAGKVLVGRLGVPPIRQARILESWTAGVLLEPTLGFEG